MAISLQAAVLVLALASGSLTAQLAVQGSNADRAYQASVVSLSQRKYAEAEAGFRQLIEVDPQNTRGAIALAQVLLAQRKSDDAIRVLQEQITKNPTRPELYLALGDAAARVGQYDLALSEYQEVLKHVDMRTGAELHLNGPGNNPDPLVQSINVLEGTGNGARGLEGVYGRIAESAWAKGDLKAAVAAEKTITELNPNGAAFLGLGSLLEAAGQKQDALAAYQTAVKLSPENGAALNNLAFIMAETEGNLDEALQYAIRGEKLLPKFPQPPDTVGWILLKQGHSDAAMSKFSEAVRLDGANASYREHLANALAQRKYTGRDFIALETALKDKPTPENQKRVRELLNRIEK
jgi:tetratricopeptide (TPR) repeat protein